MRWIAQNQEVLGKTAFHGYVNRYVHDQFESYRVGIGLTSASALLGLLIVREIQMKRLTPGVWHSGPDPRASKVSTYVPTPQALLFKEHLAELGRSVSDCVAELVEREVAEQWLRYALRKPLQELIS